MTRLSSLFVSISIFLIPLCATAVTSEYDHRQNQQFAREQDPVLQAGIRQMDLARHVFASLASRKLGKTITAPSLKAFRNSEFLLNKGEFACKLFSPMLGDEITPGSVYYSCINRRGDARFSISDDEIVQEQQRK